MDYEAKIKKRYAAYDNLTVEVVFVHERWAVRRFNGHLGIAHYHPDDYTTKIVDNGRCTSSICKQLAPDEIRVFCGLAGVPLSSKGVGV